MRLLLSLLALAATPALAAEPAPSVQPSLVTPAPLQKPCPAERGLEPLGTPGDGPMRGRKLTELPPANMELTVLRQIDGCPAPVIVRYGVDRRPGEAAPGR